MRPPSVINKEWFVSILALTDMTMPMCSLKNSTMLSEKSAFLMISQVFIRLFMSMAAGRTRSSFNFNSVLLRFYTYKHNPHLNSHNINSLLNDLQCTVFSNKMRSFNGNVLCFHVPCLAFSDFWFCAKRLLTWFTLYFNLLYIWNQESKYFVTFRVCKPQILFF